MVRQARSRGLVPRLGRAGGLLLQLMLEQGYPQLRHVYRLFQAIDALQIAGIITLIAIANCFPFLVGLSSLQKLQARSRQLHLEGLLCLVICMILRRSGLLRRRLRWSIAQRPTCWRGMVRGARHWCPVEGLYLARIGGRISAVTDHTIRRNPAIDRGLCIECQAGT